MRRKIFKNRIILISSLIIILLITTSILAPLISPHNPYTIDLSKGCQSPSLEHPFGTDINGRDILSRTLYGMRMSLLIGFLATLISMSIGLGFGVLAGYFGGIVDRLIMRIVDVTLSFPSLLLYIGISVSIGEGLLTLFIALGLYGWAEFARLVRGITLSIKERPFIEAARALGCKNREVILRHIIPNCMPIVIVVATFRIGTFILAEAGLSFLGIGVPPPTPSLGGIISQGRDFIRSAPWISIFPGLAIATIVISFNMLGDGLQDVLSPKLGPK